VEKATQPIFRAVLRRPSIAQQDTSGARTPSLASAAAQASAGLAHVPTQPVSRRPGRRRSAVPPLAMLSRVRVRVRVRVPCPVFGVPCPCPVSAASSPGTTWPARARHLTVVPARQSRRRRHDPSARWRSGSRHRQCSAAPRRPRRQDTLPSTSGRSRGAHVPRSPAAVTHGGAASQACAASRLRRGCTATAGPVQELCALLTAFEPFARRRHEASDASAAKPTIEPRTQSCRRAAGERATAIAVSRATGTVLVGAVDAEGAERTSAAVDVLAAPDRTVRSPVRTPLTKAGCLGS